MALSWATGEGQCWGHPSSGGDCSSVVFSIAPAVTSPPQIETSQPSSGTTLPPGTREHLFSAASGADPQGLFVLDSSFRFHVATTSDADPYQLTETAEMLENAIAASLDSRPNSVQVLSIDLIAPVAVLVRRLQDAPPRGGAEVEVFYRVSCSSDAEVGDALAEAARLGEPDSEITQLFVDTFNFRAVSHGVQTIAETTMSPGTPQRVEDGADDGPHGPHIAVVDEPSNNFPLFLALGLFVGCGVCLLGLKMSQPTAEEADGEETEMGQRARM